MALSWQQAMGLDDSHLVPFCDSLNKEHLIHKDIADDLNLLLAKAKDAGVEIVIVSAYRSFERQLAIWNDKWRGHRPVYSRHGRPLNVGALSEMERYKAISLFSALPGLSRHHWGSDLDIFAIEPLKQGYSVELTEAEFAKGGPCEELELWLNQHLETFGFFRPYARYQQGVACEPWHISHQQVAQKTLEEFDFDACRNYLKDSLIDASEFICQQLDHYKNQYFCNICEVS